MDVRHGEYFLSSLLAHNVFIQISSKLIDECTINTDLCASGTCRGVTVGRCALDEAVF